MSALEPEACMDAASLHRLTCTRYVDLHFAAIDETGCMAIPSRFRRIMPHNANGHQRPRDAIHEVPLCFAADSQDRYSRFFKEIEGECETAPMRNFEFDEDEAFRKHFSYSDAHVLDEHRWFLRDFTALDPMGEGGMAAFTGSAATLRFADFRRRSIVPSQRSSTSLSGLAAGSQPPKRDNEVIDFCVVSAVASTTKTPSIGGVS